MFDRFLIARPIEDVLAVVVVLFRVGSFVWMAILAVTTLTDDPNPDVNDEVVATSIVVAGVWTAATVVAWRRGVLGSPWFYAADGVVVISLALSPSIADATDFYYGGMPLSWLFVAGYVGGSALAVVSSVVLSTAVIIGVEIFPREATEVSRLGLVLVFIIPALVIAWAFDALRFTDRKRREAEAELLVERRRRIRQEERADVATRLHDSVLQTLAVIEGRTGEAETRRLARRERQSVRRLIDSLAFDADQSFKGRLLEIADRIEDAFLVEVEAAFVGNEALDEGLELLCAATNEALTNAAKHSGSAGLSLFAEVTEHRALTAVKDEGRGIDDPRILTALERSLTRRLATGRGRASIRSTPGSMTIVELSLPRGEST